MKDNVNQFKHNSKLFIISSVCLSVTFRHQDQQRDLLTAVPSSTHLWFQLLRTPCVWTISQMIVKAQQPLGMNRLNNRKFQWYLNVVNAAFTLKLVGNLLGIPALNFPFKSSFAWPFTFRSNGWNWLVILLGTCTITQLFSSINLVTLSVIWPLKISNISIAFISSGNLSSTFLFSTYGKSTICKCCIAFDSLLQWFAVYVTFQSSGNSTPFSRQRSVVPW